MTTPRAARARMSLKSVSTSALASPEVGSSRSTTAGSKDIARRRANRPRQELEERRLARSVSADEGADLPRLEGDRDAVERSCPRVVLGESMGRERGMAHAGPPMNEGSVRGCPAGRIGAD